MCTWVQFGIGSLKPNSCAQYQPSLPGLRVYCLNDVISSFKGLCAFIYASSRYFVKDMKIFTRNNNIHFMFKLRKKF